MRIFWDVTLRHCVPDVWNEHVAYILEFKVVFIDLELFKAKGDTLLRKTQLPLKMKMAPFENVGTQSASDTVSHPRTGTTQQATQ
jgi:hypothetical protein